MTMGRRAQEASDFDRRYLTTTIVPYNSRALLSPDYVLERELYYALSKSRVPAWFVSKP